MPDVDPKDVVPAGATPAPGGGHFIPPDDVSTIPALPAKYGGDILSPKPGIFRRNAAPIAGQTIGQLGGEAGAAAILGALGLASETGGASLIPLLAGVAGAGLGNVAASKLPEKYGGTPGESKTSSFLWGALPALGGAGASRAVGGRLAGKQVAAHAEDAEKFAKDVAKQAAEQHGLLAEGLKGGPPSRGAVVRAGNIVGSPTAAAAAPLGNVEANTAATQEAIEAVSGPIERMQAERGKPIGEAYKSLKGGEQFLTEQEAGKLAQAAQGIRGDLISPAPKAEKTLKRLREYNLAPANEATVSKRIELPDGTIIEPSQQSYTEMVKSRGRENIEHFKKLGLMPKGAEIEPPPTYDELRDLRQRVEAQARSAKGGDRYALNRLKHEVDNVLMPRLPDNMNQMRATYQGFIKNYERLTPLRRAGTSEQVGDWLFNQRSEVMHQIVSNATPEERGVYQRLFADRVFTKVSPEMPAGQQIQALKQAVQPYLTNGTARALYGDGAAREMSKIIYTPARRAAALTELRSPQGKRTFIEAASKEAQRLGKFDLQAVQAGYEKWVGSLPPEMQKTVRDSVGPAPPAEPVALPSPQQSLAERLRQPKKASIPQFASRYAIGAGLGAAAGIASGGGFMVRAALGFGTMAALAAGQNALMRAGGADLVANLYAKPTARFLGSQAIKTLAIMGGRGVHQEVTPEQIPAAPSLPATHIEGP